MYVCVFVLSLDVDECFNGCANCDNCVYCFDIDECVLHVLVVSSCTVG